MWKSGNSACGLLTCVLALAGLVGGYSTALGAEKDADWPADVANYKAVAPGEHPRLLFRKTDVPALREKAKTAEGQAITKRLRATLNGSDGESIPTAFNGSGHAYQGNKATESEDANADNGKTNSNKNVGKSIEMPLGAFTISHAAGFGLLYQLTGEKKYADLGRQCFEMSMKGVRDRDDRYSFRTPGGSLRCGPSLGWSALGYDLCYDGWDPEFREKVAAEFSKYNEGPHCSIEECILGKRQKPGSNHWGMEVGGSAMAMLGILNDPGCDMKKFSPLFEASQQIMVRNMTEGFGDGGFFPEGDGTGSMSSHIVFLPALQAWRNAAGKDFITPRPNAQWMANKWFLLTQSNKGKPIFQPQRGAYAHNIWARDGLSGGGYFSIGLGVAANDQVKAGILGYYDHFGFADVDAKAGTPFDTPSPYPHHSILAFVNWPIGMEAKSLNDAIPHAVHDDRWGFYAWRNKYQDNSDVIISILTKSTKGNYGCKGELTLSILTGGKSSKWGTIRGFTGDFAPAASGSTVLTTGDGSCLAIDFSGASGSGAMLVMTGQGAGKGDVVEAGANKFTFLFPGGAPTAKPAVDGNKVKVGDQNVSFDGKKIVLERM